MILNFDASNIKPEDDKISHDEELDNRIRELTKGKFKKKIPFLDLNFRLC